MFIKICLYFNACLFLYPDSFLKINDVFYSNKWYSQTKVNNIVGYNLDLVKMRVHVDNHTYAVILCSVNSWLCSPNLTSVSMDAAGR